MGLKKSKNNTNMNGFKKLITGIILLFFCSCLIFFTYIINLYPLKFKNEIEYFSKYYNIDKYLLASIINTESSYNPDAESSSGAIGLMQLMPETANEIAQKLNIDSYDLTDYKTNINFGCFYLRYLLNYYNENMELSLCAYNAGLNNVDNWLNDTKYSSDKKTLKNNPFSETKNYLKKINRNKKVYMLIYWTK